MGSTNPCQLALSLIDGGLSVPKAAAAVGVHRSTVWRWLNARDTTTKHRDTVPGDEMGFRVLVVPDTHFGWYTGPAGTLSPIHDPKAVRWSVEQARACCPDVIIQLGDLLDLCGWSTKFVSNPAYKHTTQQALDSAHQYLNALRAVCPNARIIVLEGNHEVRIRKMLATLVPEAVDLRPAGGGTNPVLSVPHLVGMDKLNVEYIDGYPGADVWLDDTRYTHGSIARKWGGATAAAMLSGTSHSVVFGHIHRVELAGRQVRTAAGAKTIWCASPGTLARTDGTVPGSRGRCDWQQGLIVVENGGFPRIIPRP